LNQTVCFASAEYNTTYENYYTIYKTSNSGYNWIQITNGTGWFLKKIIFVDSITGFACGGLNRLYMTENQYGKCILKTTNGGQNWNTVYNIISIPGSEMEITDMCFWNSSTGWASSRDGSIMKTTNSGINFTANYTAPFFRKSSVFFVGPLYGWTAGDSGRIAYTINGGINWSTLNSLSTSHFKSIFFLTLNTGFVCGNNGIVYKSTNGGVNWSALNSLVTSNLNSVYFLNPDTGWVAGINSILKTTNGGLNWINQYSSNASLNSIRFFNSFIGWSCGGNKMLYTNSGGIVNIKEISSLKPSMHKLYNNYPNPFNPTTKIRIDLPDENTAILKVYDNLGRGVTTLLNRKLKPGTYDIEFNASSLSSGIYFYKLTSGNYTSTKSMVIIK
jgi:photosystem II stability/assembly factor-like uncharacterized protein